MATRRYGDACDDGDREPIEPLDFSWIIDLFNSCDPDHPSYDRELHLDLFKEKPHWFGGDGLPMPRDATAGFHAPEENA